MHRADVATNVPWMRPLLVRFSAGAELAVALAALDDEDAGHWPDVCVGDVRARHDAGALLVGEDVSWRVL